MNVPQPSGITTSETSVAGRFSSLQKLGWDHRPNRRNDYPVRRWLNGTVDIASAPPEGLSLSARTEREEKWPSKRHLELYEVYRAYVKHESTLIHNRLNWNFTIQGFLFAAYSFSVQKIADVKGNLLIRADMGTPQTLQSTALASIRDLKLVNFIICAVGFLVSMFVYCGIWAARTAIDEVEARWHEENPDYRPESPENKKRKKPKTHGPHLPGLLGGGSPTAHLWGGLAPPILCTVFMMAWAVLFFYGVFSNR